MYFQLYDNRIFYEVWLFLNYYQQIKKLGTQQTFSIVATMF